MTVESAKRCLPRSFLFSLHPTPVPTGHLSCFSPRGQLSLSAGYQCTVQGDEAAFAVLVGYCFDLRSIEKSEADIAIELLRRCVSNGIDAMFADTDDLVGRYTAICFTGKRWVIFNDAGGMRSTYFAEAAPIIASHSSIIGDLYGRAARRDLFKRFRFGLPGNASPVEGVRLIPPNFELDLESRQLRRFWPRIPRIEKSSEELIAPLIEVLTRTADGVVRRHPPALSLTAGVDSRTTLACFQHVKSTVTFTYLGGTDDAEFDAAIAQKLAARLGMQHRVLPLVEDESGKALTAEVAALVDFKHLPDLTACYKRAFGGGNFIHVRSNLGEIGRAFWRKHHVMPTRFAATNWPDVAADHRRTPKPLRDAAIKYMREQMHAFFQLAGYDLSDPTNPQLLGYDAWDLIYWEHRMATWHSQLLLGSDYVFDTAIVFNSRRALELLLSAPLADRLKSRLFYMTIQHLIPQVSDVPFSRRIRRRSRFIELYRTLRRRSALLQAIDRKTGLIARL